MSWSVLRSFALSRALVFTFAAAGFFLLPAVHEGIAVPLDDSTPWFLSMWYQWDANWYMSIASQGYQWVSGDQSNVAFFPLYPLAMKGLGGLLGGSYLAAGLLLSSSFLLAGLVFFYRLVRLDFSEAVASRAVWLLAIFPTAVFFSTIYTESLFLLTSVAAFYYARRGRWAWAGLWGGLAALTRITGLLLLIPLVYEYLSQRSFSWKRLSPSLLWLALIPGGLLLYIGYLYQDFGRPLAFVETQAAGWGHEFTLLVGSFTHDLPFLFNEGELWVTYELAATALLALLAVLAFKLLPRSYGIYMLLSLLLPLVGGTTKSVSRYVVVVFPVFILLAMATKKRPLSWAATALSLALLAVASAAFVTGRWVA